jgi:biopolymer transport protein ExbD
MRRTRRNKRREVHTELNITAFMNLMVVLIPFLLLTAVFSQVSILKLDLPGSASETPAEETEQMALEVLIRADRLVLAERKQGVIAEYPVADDQLQSSFVTMNSKLQEIKALNQEHRAITILAEPDTSYDLIIQTMDAVRMIPVAEGSEELPGELFPDISLGSAPVDPMQEATS